MREKFTFHVTYKDPETHTTGDEHDVYIALEEKIEEVLAEKGFPTSNVYLAKIEHMEDL